VRVNNYLGQSDGRVASVAPERIEIVELVSDGAGGWLERQASLALDDK
jgi:type IV pilus assembly protein PilP